MSLTALLLGLPGKVRKLRAFDAPKIPLHVPGYSYQSGLTTNYTYERSCPLYSASLEKLGTNNAVVASYEVINLSGKGAVNGVWVSTISATGTGAPIQLWGLEILLDGTDITPPGWVHNVVPSFGETRRFCFTSPAIGGVQANKTADSSTSTYRQFTYTHVMVPASVPIPFDSSLVVNFIHLESNSSNSNIKNTCWVNAWLTE